MSQIRTNAILDANGGTTATVNGYAPSLSNMAGRNRIINGDMTIDQRNAGASVTPAVGVATYITDRWNIYPTQASKLTTQKNQGGVTPPAGFTNYLGVTSSSAYSLIATDLFVLDQPIEGFNVADLGWGTANAQPVTLSFWVRSSLTGQFSGSFMNSAQTRSYPFVFTINAANTWEQKTVTASGDTTGTWLTDNGIGLYVYFSLGTGSNFTATANTWTGSNRFAATGSTSLVGTNGATFYITGVQLEAGSIATPFERRLYGPELALCQRYYYALEAGRNSSNLIVPVGYAGSSTNAWLFIPHPVTMRVAPSVATGNWASGNPTSIGPGTDFTSFNVASWTHYFNFNSYYRANAEL
jgi:hypothetical protein